MILGLFLISFGVIELHLYILKLAKQLVLTAFCFMIS